METGNPLREDSEKYYGVLARENIDDEEEGV